MCMIVIKASDFYQLIKPAYFDFCFNINNIRPIERGRYSCCSSMSFVFGTYIKRTNLVQQPIYSYKYYPYDNPKNKKCEGIMMCSGYGW